MVNRYPLWKNLLLLLIVVLSFIYAAPNLYGENPAIQISGGQGTPAPSVLKIQQLLQQESLPYLSVALERQTALIRFANTDLQLKAADQLKAALGKGYTVALNLVPATPAWLKALGATPMKLGLDLRGGVHFLLNVDMSALVTERQQATVESLMQSLRKARIRYAAITLQRDNRILLQFRQTDQQQAAMPLIKQDFPQLQISQNDLQLIASLTPAALSTLQQNTLQQTMTTLRNRVNELGVSEAIVQQQGNDRVSVDLPGIQDTAHAKNILGGTATLAFRLVDAQATAGKTTRYYYHGQPILLDNQTILSGKSITDASASFDENGRAAVNIQLGGGGESLFNHITAANVGHPLAVVYIETNFVPQIINGKTIKVPQKSERIINVAEIKSALGSSFQITGLSSQQTAQNLSLLLRAGALPAAINYEEERTVGPTLGQENIDKGILSLAVAMGIVIIFMALYYRLFGLIADVALILNLVLLVAVLSLLGATLTLPGIAGIVLNVGMAVDANVLIYERIREELREGNTPQASIHAGYQRAWITILDANITTLIVAMVLFGIGTDAIKGFAVTLTIGVLTSMLTGVVMTRAMVNACYGGKMIKRLAIGL